MHNYCPSCSYPISYLAKIEYAIKGALKTKKAILFSFINYPGLVIPEMKIVEKCLTLVSITYLQSVQGGK